MVRSLSPVLWFVLIMTPVIQNIRVAPRVELRDTSKQTNQTSPRLMEGAERRSHVVYRLLRSGQESRPRSTRLSMSEPREASKCPIAENEEQRSKKANVDEEDSRESLSPRFEQGFIPISYSSRGVSESIRSDTAKDFSSSPKSKVKNSFGHAAMIPVSLIPVFGEVSFEEPTKEKGRMRAYNLGAVTSGSKESPRYLQSSFPIPVQLYPVHVSDKFSIPLQIPVAFEYETPSTTLEGDENASRFVNRKSLQPYHGRRPTSRKTLRNQQVECPYGKTTNGHGFYDSRKDFGDLENESVERISK